MIKFVSGDILKSKCDAIVHGVSPNDDFKRGLAFSIRENWPALYKDFRHYTQTSHPKTGTLWTWNGNGFRVVNLFTQEGSEGHQAVHGGKATLTHVSHCLKALRKEIETQGFKSIALPRLSTGVGGLEWENVEPLIKEHLGNLPIPVLIYDKYVSGTAAVEGV